GSGEGNYGSGEGGLGNKTDHDVSMTQGTPVILGSLDKEIIRRIVQEHASQIKYCYERELTRTPGIFGKIKMKWVINGDGKVTQSQTEETQMHNANVENCLAQKIKGWVFPKPKGGGIVIVSYPFVFKQSG
ncbi:MAG TPA: AgmX/PglI C-terminal domain-containing protein, partial [Myxococcota bacterium]